MPGRKVCDYLLREARDRNASEVVCDGLNPAQIQPNHPFTVYFYPAMNHAQFLFHPRIEDDLVECCVSGARLEQKTSDEGYDTSGSPLSIGKTIGNINNRNGLMKPLTIENFNDAGEGGVKHRLRSY